MRYLLNIAHPHHLADILELERIHHNSFNKANNNNAISSEYQTGHSNIGEHTGVHHGHHSHYQEMGESLMVMEENQEP